MAGRRNIKSDARKNRRRKLSGLMRGKISIRGWGGGGPTPDGKRGEGNRFEPQ